MQMTSLGFAAFCSGVATSLNESADFLSRWLEGGGGPLDTEWGVQRYNLTGQHDNKTYTGNYILDL